MKLRISRCAVLALLVSTGVPARAAEPERVVSETAEAVLVEVPVRVVDRQGNPIRGLTADEFEVYDEGRRQAIVGFDAIDLAQKGLDHPGDIGPLPPAARRRFLLLFDMSYSRPKELLAAQRAAKEFVLSGLGDQDLAAVASFSVEQGVRILVTFSNDRAQLARAVDTLGLADPTTIGSDPLGFMYDVMAAAFGGTRNPGATNEAQAAGLLDTLETHAALVKAHLDHYERARVVRMTQSLRDLATALDAVQGRKDVIYLSEGFETRLLVGAKRTDRENEFILSGEPWRVDNEKSYGNYHLQTLLREMTAVFRRTDCVVHAVDVGGLAAEVGSSPDADPMMARNALFEIANETGGEVFRNDNNLKAQLDRLIARTSLVYVLAFRPDRSGVADGYHELRVKVKRSGASVSARAGYYERKTFRALSPLERNLSAADVLANEIPVQDIGVRVLAVPRPAEGGIAHVPILVELSGEHLLEGEKDGRASIELYAYANDTQNRLSDFFTQTVFLDVAASRQKLRMGGLRYWGELELPPGEHRLRVLVRNGQTGRMGLSVQSLRVPDFSAPGPYLAPPIFVESASAGVVVQGAARPGERRALRSDDMTIQSGGESLVPTALPEARPGTPLQVSVVAYHFRAPEAGELMIGAQVLAADGRPLGDGAIAVLGRSGRDPEDRQTLLVAFTPQSLAPGPYALRVFLRNPATGQAGYASAPFLVR